MLDSGAGQAFAAGPPGLCEGGEAKLGEGLYGNIKLLSDQEGSGVRCGEAAFQAAIVSGTVTLVVCAGEQSGGGVHAQSVQVIGPKSTWILFPGALAPVRGVTKSAA